MEVVEGHLVGMDDIVLQEDKNGDKLVDED